MRRATLPALYTLSVLLSILPVAIYFIANREAYVSTRAEGIRLLFGGALALFVVVIKALGFLKIKSSIIVFLAMFVFSYLLESVISDLLVFSFLALTGEVMSMIVRIFINKEKEKIQEKKTEDVIENAILKSSGRV